MISHHETKLVRTRWTDENSSFHPQKTKYLQDCYKNCSLVVFTYFQVIRHINYLYWDSLFAHKQHGQRLTGWDSGLVRDRPTSVFKMRQLDALICFIVLILLVGKWEIHKGKVLKVRYKLYLCFMSQEGQAFLKFKCDRVSCEE